MVQLFEILNIILQKFYRRYDLNRKWQGSRFKIDGEIMRSWFNHFNPEFTIVIFIHYKPQIAVAILDL